MPDSADIMKELSHLSGSITALNLLMTKEVAELRGAIGEQKARSLGLSKFVYWQAGVVFAMLAGQWVAIGNLLLSLP